MLHKWYIELPALLSAIALPVYFILQTGSNSFLPQNTDVAIRATGDTVILTPRQVEKLAHKEKWNEGKSLFKSNCASCHNPKADGTGPALQGVTERWNTAGKYKKKNGQQWMYAWVKNWHDVVDAGYPYGIAMAKSRTTEMNVFTTLTDENVEAIIFYVECADITSPRPTVVMPIASVPAN